MSIFLLIHQNADDEELEKMMLEQMADMPDLEFKDDGYIELVLRILGLMCDNQHFGLQVFRFRKLNNLRFAKAVGLANQKLCHFKGPLER